jgi:hypothetical protein
MRAAGIFAEKSQQSREAAIALIQRFGVATIQDIPEDQFGTFATELRALGAAI